MAQTIRLTITPELENALKILREYTSGTLNTTELVKLAVGGFAKVTEEEKTIPVYNMNEETEKKGLLALKEHTEGKTSNA